jgi:hypothetical protein
VSSYTPQQLKKALVESGFEVFRTRGDEIVLAERVRENLILDSGVRLRIGPPFQVVLVLRAQRAEWPSDDETDLFARVRELAAVALRDGFSELHANVAPVRDPADAERTLDTFYEITYSREEPELQSALEGLRYALKLEKSASPRARQE